MPSTLNPGCPAVDDSPTNSRARTADEVTATAITQPPRSGWLMRPCAGLSAPSAMSTTSWYAPRKI